ncbi:MAG: family 78 glycoside hydrolase catalytic domain [Chloroflexi bacterium]|nr:family 78 glycoside hydrolase catalytic domain [Chloroflexota bacterium]
MKITRLKTNHVKKLLGFALDKPVLSWIVEDTRDKKQTASQVVISQDDAFTQILFDSGKVSGAEIDSIAYRPNIPLSPRTRYFWKVRVWGETESAESETTWFETAKMGEPWQAQWITPDFQDHDTHPFLFKNFELPAKVVLARAYICGLGLYHFELNGERVGDEHLTPYLNAYDQWIQYQTFDVTEQLNAGSNFISVMLGNGWYKGRYGLQDYPNEPKPYGEKFALICELHIELENGKRLVLATDKTWNAMPAPVLASDIYDGETYDARITKPGKGKGKFSGVKKISLDTKKLQARRSLPVRVNEEIKPKTVIQTPAGETVLDMGQNMTGWIRFKTSAPSGTCIHLQFGEVLNDGNFYRDNLRTAKAEYIFIADGTETVTQPFFTFYGFRYVKITGWVGDLNLDNFTGCVVYSDMDVIGHIETSDAKVNQLFRNTLWSLKGNFLDIPTDCPQRDERLGWAGDAQMFSGTACFNMEASAFLGKFVYDMGREQAKFGGMVPWVIPAAHMTRGGSSAWGDAATIIPWNVYQFYGDKSILEQQFESMCAWVDFIKKADDAAGSKRLWTTGFHFGDWLALDGNDPNSPMGGTPEDFISSAYYFYSANLTARAAAVLGKTEPAAEYYALAGQIKAAIQKEYFTATGRLAIGTQTGLVLTLFMDIAPEEFRARIASDLVSRLRKDKVHLRTGFIGTPYLCRVLSSCGANELAYQLLLNEDYPSWLYAINLGATTIWERWNSLKPDGSFSSTEMNSFNHYAYGSIVEWMYRDMCGLNPSAGDDLATGFRRARIAPKPDKSMKWAKARYRSTAGLFESGWQIEEDGKLSFEFAVPFNVEAQVVLPDASLGEIFINGKKSTSGIQQGSGVVMLLETGYYRVEYKPSRPYLETLSTYVPAVKILRNKMAKLALLRFIPMIAVVNEAMISAIGNDSLRDLAATPYLNLSDEKLDEIDRLLSNFPIKK